MSMTVNHSMLEDSWALDWFAGGVARRVDSFVTWGFVEKTSEIAETAATVVNANDETMQWLATITGAFDGDPMYAQVIENIKENRKRLIEEFASLE